MQKLGDYDFQVVCGTATAGIPWAAIIADRLNKPLAYVRGKKKEHGKAKVVEGAEVKGKKVILIEDLISTGGSSIKAAESLAAEPLSTPSWLSSPISLKARQKMHSRATLR